MAELDIQPEELKTTFWDDLARGFPSVKYLGLQKSEIKTYLLECAQRDTQSAG